MAEFKPYSETPPRCKEMSYFIKRKILRWLFKIMRKTPLDMPMVAYWKRKESVPAKVTTNKDGALVMKLEGEKYDFPGFPRGHLLFGTLSKLKHEIKNQIFNESWRLLEEGKPRQEVINRSKEVIKEIDKYVEQARYDMIPPERMVKPVREIWRAWTKVEGKNENARTLKKALTYILQEDDAYRFRVQDMAEYFDPNMWWKKVYRFVFRKSYTDSIKKDFEIALTIIEHCEVVGDMKAKQRLLRRIVLLSLENRRILELFEKFCREVNWRKLYLTEADRYHFRAKWYKTDYRLFEY